MNPDHMSLTEMFEALTAVGTARKTQIIPLPPAPMTDAVASTLQYYGMEMVPVQYVTRNEVIKYGTKAGKYVGYVGIFNDEKGWHAYNKGLGNGEPFFEDISRRMSVQLFAFNGEKLSDLTTSDELINLTPVIVVDIIE
jgi:hypothetical protein